MNTDACPFGLPKPSPERRAEAVALHTKVVAKFGAGRMSAAQIRAAGVDWNGIHAMHDAGLVKYDGDAPAGGSDPSRVITFWRVLFP